MHKLQYKTRQRLRTIMKHLEKAEKELIEVYAEQQNSPTSYPGIKREVGDEVEDAIWRVNRAIGAVKSLRRPLPSGSNPIRNLIDKFKSDNQ